MIARFTIAMPFIISLIEGEILEPFNFVADGYTGKIYPPYQSKNISRSDDPLSTIELLEVLEELNPITIPQSTNRVTFNGLNTIPTNALKIDFFKPQFSRTPGMEGDDIDPPLSLCFTIANSFIGRLRLLNRGSHVKPLLQRKALWRIDYLSDNEEILPIDPALIRTTLKKHVSFTACCINKNLWENIESLPNNFTAPLWDVLILDARNLLPEVGPAMVVASAAIETFIAWCLDQLQLSETSSVPTDLWNWINDRSNDFYKQPSVDERCDILLKVLTGKSLKDNSKLWQSYNELRKARNSFSHAGTAVRYKKNNVILDLAHATRLVSDAEAIIDWIEALLPDNLRRKKIDDLGMSLGNDVLTK